MFIKIMFFNKLCACWVFVQKRPYVWSSFVLFLCITHTVLSGGKIIFRSKVLFGTVSTYYNINTSVNEHLPNEKTTKKKNKNHTITCSVSTYIVHIMLHTFAIKTITFCPILVGRKLLYLILSY